MMRTKKLITPYFENNEFAGARVTLGDEDFVIAPKDYKQGNGMSWPEAMDALNADGLTTWNYKQVCLTMAYRDDIDNVLKGNGGDGLDDWYWISDEYSERSSFSYYGFNGSLEIINKNNNACSIRPIKNLKQY